jgi:hypothetical protein
MRKFLLSILSIMFLAHSLNAQSYYTQYFDGADTSALNSLLIELDTSSSNIWQIGPPQKVLFNSAATVPNVIVTDTINNYPPGNTSSFSFQVINQFGFQGVLALQWMQKLDLDTNYDGGLIEFSVNDGLTWENAFNNPYVYNFYGFNNENHDTLVSGENAFSGTDTTWRDIWLCLDLSWLSFQDTAMMRFTLKSDSVDNGREGWMIDNMMAHITIVHTLKNDPLPSYLNVFPNPASNIVHIEAQKLQQFHIIETMELYDAHGRLVESWRNIPTKFWINTEKYANGNYLLKVKTNIKSETIPLVIARQ